MGTKLGKALSTYSMSVLIVRGLLLYYGVSSVHCTYVRVTTIFALNLRYGRLRSCLN